MQLCSVHQRAGKRQTKPNPKYEDEDEAGKGVGTPRGGGMPGTPSGKQEHPMTPVMTSKSGKGAFHGKGGMLLTPRSASGGKGAMSSERLGTPASGGSSHKKKQQRGDSSSGWGSEDDHSPSYRTSHKKKRNYSNVSSPEDGEGGKRKYSKKGSSSAERRSKHHNPWSQQEAEALVEGVAVCGGGKWADIKKLGYPAISNRSAVDLKDKWRNLLRIALLPNPPTPKVSLHASLHPLPFVRCRSAHLPGGDERAHVTVLVRAACFLTRRARRHVDVAPRRLTMVGGTCRRGAMGDGRRTSRATRSARSLRRYWTALGRWPARRRSIATPSLRGTVGAARWSTSRTTQTNELPPSLAAPPIRSHHISRVQSVAMRA